MFSCDQKSLSETGVQGGCQSLPKSLNKRSVVGICLLLLGILVSQGVAQVNVLTAHNDIARTGQNLNETMLTPANVGSPQFGKLFSQPVDGLIRFQPLYVWQLTIPEKGTHNVVYVGTSAGTMYAFDADINGGLDAAPLWKTSLLTVAGSRGNSYTILGTPVIDLPSKTMYAVATSAEGANRVSRLHALDITTGAEKFGGPIEIRGFVPGTGSGSSGGVLTFDASLEIQRSGLLMLNGVVYVPFGSLNDNGSWHGWIFSYNAKTLKLIDIYCTSPNGSGAGIWMGGAGLAAEVNDPTKPFGRMFFATGNGDFAVSKPYTNAMSYSMSVENLDLTGGVMTVKDSFTPFNEAHVNAYDGDLGSGGVVLLPSQTLSSGKTLSPLAQVGKYGTILILDRNNLGGFDEDGDHVVQELQTPVAGGSSSWGAGIWGSGAYWNKNLYFGGTNPGLSNSVVAYSFVNGVMSTTPTSQTTERFSYPGPTPTISSNGTQNGIVWLVKTDAVASSGPAVLVAVDAKNLENMLYISNANFSRDNPGAAMKFMVPTVANGKVFIGGSNRLNVYGLLGSTPTVAPPVFTPRSGSFTGSQTVTISDATSGAQIYYTTDGSMPTINSRPYTGPITVTSSLTITAIANAPHFLQGQPVSATFSSSANAVGPVFSLAAGSYSGIQTLTLSDATKGASIYYTVDGETPTSSSTLYTKPITIPVSETVRAFATAPGLLPSFVVSKAYVIGPVYTFDFSQGFSQAQGPIQFNGSTDLDDFRLQLTNGGTFEAGSAFYSTPVNVQAFTTDFVFQLSNPVADGMTFTIQGVGPTALGGRGGSLGYAGIEKSVAIKFDLSNGQGEGVNSTGLYLNGAAPTVPAVNLVGTGINLHSGDYMGAHVTYDGSVLNLTLNDQLTGATWSSSFVVNIPAVVGGAKAYVGFTAGTGGSSSSQKVTYWTYISGPLSVPNYASGFTPAGLTLNGAALSGTSLQLTSGGVNQVASVYFSKTVAVGAFTSDFDFLMTKALGDGITFVIQNTGPTALGSKGGGLGYADISKSVAIKFDLYNNAGEGTDSTGVYVGGATPTVPSIDMTSSGLRLNVGHVIHAHIVYDGVNLTWTVTDAQLHWFATNHVTINIPESVGNSTAYVGFTGATGGATSIQKIIDWTYTAP